MRSWSKGIEFICVGFDIIIIGTFISFTANHFWLLFFAELGVMIARRLDMAKTIPYYI